MSIKSADSVGDIACPFCGEPEFDKEGLKMHLVYGFCEVYPKVEVK